MRIRYVKQEQAMGCAVACCAMVTGQTYKEVAAHFQADLDRGGVRLEHLRNYVCAHGFAALEVHQHGANERAVANRRMLTPFADAHILLARPCVDSTVMHAVVMARGGEIYDPERGPDPAPPTAYYVIESALGLFDERGSRRRK